MQIVINIPDDVYKVLKEDIYPISDTERLALVFKTLVKKGTPLPKGHGRLADLDAALKCVEETADCDEKYYAMCLFDWAMSKRVVLEADKAENEVSE